LEFKKVLFLETDQDRMRKSQPFFAIHRRVDQMMRLSRELQVVTHLGSSLCQVLYSAPLYFIVSKLALSTVRLM
jgi:hypothetical protein